LKRHVSDGYLFASLKKFDEFARKEGLSTETEGTHDQFMKCISETVQKHRRNSSLLHGFRVESMFAHVAAALGECEIINEEDSGTFFSIDGKLVRPDFRLLLRSGDQYLVEVKNFRPKDPFKPYRIKGTYLSSIRSYAVALGVPLKIAIYWSAWNMWSLVDVNHFNKTRSDFQISMPDAMKRSEMVLLGDCMVATVPPLALRFYADPQKPRSVGESGEVAFTIGRAVVCAGDEELTDPLESSLAWFFMLYGKWEEVDQSAKVTESLLQYTEMKVSPIQSDPKQGFAILGFLSEMISRQYNQLTAGDGEIRHLIPQAEPDQLGVLIPHDHKGKVLKLWRFNVQPNFDDITKKAS
jgi:hypothetical protein